MMKQAGRADAILMTGVTGLVGSSVVVALVKRRVECSFICIVRSRAGVSAFERVRTALRDECDFEGCPELLSDILNRITVIDEDVATFDALKVAASGALRSVNKVFHCAADVNLGKDPAGKVFNVNFEGTKNMIALAKLLGVDEFHFVSTAYVAGKQAGVIYEEAQNPASFNNPYEESKCKAEGLVRSAGIPFSIYRPGIIVGRRSDGRIRKPLAFYRILEFLQKLKERAAKRKAVDPGSWVDMDMNCRAVASRNVYFVPIDYVQEAISTLLQLKPGNLTYHVTGSRPVSADQILEAVCNVFRLRGVTIGMDRECKTAEERMFTKWVGDLFPYFSSDLIFDQAMIFKDVPASKGWEYGYEDLRMMVWAYLNDQFSHVQWVDKMLHEDAKLGLNRANAKEAR